MFPVTGDGAAAGAAGGVCASTSEGTANDEVMANTSSDLRMAGFLPRWMNETPSL
jgi:hypothetical protein